MNIFLDACTLIYRVEDAAPWSTRITSLLSRLRTKYSTVQIAISRLSVLECRIKPLRDRNEVLLDRYNTLFSAPDLSIVEIDADVMEGATLLRAYYDLRTPDAIQAASCLKLNKPRLLISNDPAFQRVAALDVHLI